MCECLFVLEQDMGRHGKRYFFTTRAAAGDYLEMMHAPLFTQGTAWKVRPA